jgi:ABC-2 type transport system ATP-binding protein
LASTVLAFDSVFKSYGETVALDDLSLAVDAGEVFGLLGPNGAGKTTLIRVALDILRPDRGDISLFGRALDRDGLDRVSYLPEERGLYRRERVLEVLVYFGRLKGMSRGDARASATRWLERIGLGETASWRVERLSKGMSQKVQIAAALMTDPELCILDEPFSGLDPVNVRLVKDLIAERRRAGCTTILSTHMMNQAQALCDRVAMVDHGRRVLYGTLTEVREAHSVPEVRVRVDGDLPPHEAILGATVEDDGARRLRLHAGTDVAKLLADVVAAGARISHWERALAPLEDVFVDVVERRRRGSA